MRTNAIVITLLSLGAAIPDGARAMQGNANDPAHAMLRSIASTYKGLPGYADQGTVTLKVTAAGASTISSQAKPFAFARPNRISAAFEPARFVVDGDRTVSILEDRYLVSEAPEALSVDVLARDPAASHVFGGLTGVPSMTLFRLLTAVDAYDEILQGVARLALDADRPVDDRPHKVLRIVPEAGPEVLLLIDPATNLISRIEIEPSASDLPPSVTIDELAWTSGTINAGVPPDARFGFEATSDAVRVDSKPALMAGPDALGPDSTLAVGEPAPDFSFEVLAGEGRTRRLGRDALKGKVVLINAWASWCAPCFPELAEVAALVDRRAETPAADRLRVVSLNIDTPPPAGLDATSLEALGAGRIGDVRLLAEATLRSRGLRLDRPPIALVGLDPQGRAVDALRIHALPTLILIGPDGIVRAVHVGRTPEVVDEVSGEIDALLAP